MNSFRKGIAIGLLLILLFVFISWANLKTGWDWLWWAIPLAPVLFLLGIMLLGGGVVIVVGAWMWLTDRPAFYAMLQTERDIRSGKYGRKLPSKERDR